jgi:hypothetical protein
LLERESAQELKRMDVEIIKDMDKESRLLQEELTKVKEITSSSTIVFTRSLLQLKVPLFKVTLQPQDLQAQQKVLAMLVDMM